MRQLINQNYIMNRFSTHLVLLLCFVSFLAKSQTQRCHSDEKMQHIFDQNPSYEAEIEQGFQDFNRGLVKPINRMGVLIPVHVIIVHQPGEPIGVGDNLTMDRIVSQIDVLNEDFTRTNPDAGNTPPVFAAADAMIEFCLATVDPNGNPSDGVTRYGTSQDFDSNEFSIKAATGWPRDNYLNIWVANLSGGLLGYAYLPSTNGLPNATLDGVVSGTPYFGGPGQATGSPYDLGRTVTHEVGHYLGLRHIWRSSGCGTDDGMNDTPLQDDENFGCPNHPSPSCSNGGDMFMNYMDYVNDNCMNAFSQDQADYMNTILSTSRSSLASSAGFACAASNPLSFEIVDQGDPLCYLSFDGYVTVEANGGNGAYTFSLDNGQNNTTGIFTNLSAGIYDVTVDDGNESITLSFTLMEPILLEIFETTVIDNVCFGDTDGYIEVFGDGGTSASGSYQYQLNLDPPINNGVFENLPNDTYTVSVIDDNGCSTQLNITIDSPSELIANLVESTPINCNGDTTGRIIANAMGGSPNYEYSIGGTYQSSGIFLDLAAGNYVVSVKDANQCIALDTVDLLESEQLITTILNTDHVSCNGGTDGRIEVNTQGGTPSFIYIIGSDTSTSNTFIDLALGTYTIKTLDLNGCETLDTASITQPSILVPSVLAASLPVCSGANNGFINLGANGGISPYTYILGTETNTNGQFAGLVPGTYDFEIQDANNCTSIITGEVLSNPSITQQVATTPPLCFGDANGTILVQSTGGTGTLQYRLNNGSLGATGEYINLAEGDYTLSTTDQLGCIESSSIYLDAPDLLTPTLSIKQDPCGNSNEWSVDFITIGGTSPYTFTVDGETYTSINGETTSINGTNNFSGSIDFNDANGCTLDIPLEITLIQPMTFVIESVSPANCDGTSLGSIDIDIISGTAPYNYSLGAISNDTGLFIDLTGGNHTIIVTDSDQCSKSFVISIPTNADGFEIEDIIATNVSCYQNGDGMVNATVNGGSGNFTYTLNGTNNDTGIFTELQAGTYELSVYDVTNDCNLTSEVVITEPAELTGDANIIYGAFEGENKLVINPTGGVAPYQYALDNISEVQSDNVFSGLNTGSHVVYIIDANDCQYTIDLSITSSNDILENDDITIFPNPFTNQFNVQIDVSSTTAYDLSILDLNGKIIQNMPNIIFSQSKNIQTFQTKYIESSIYIIKIASGKDIIYRKVFVR